MRSEATAVVLDEGPAVRSLALVGRRPAAGKAAPQAQVGVGVKTILVVDRYPLVGEGVARLVAAWRDRPAVHMATSLDAVPRWMDDRSADVGLVLVGLRRVDGDASSALGALIARYPGLPLLVVAGAADGIAAIDLMRRGVRGLVPARAAASVIAGAMRLVMAHGGTYLPPELFVDCGMSGSAWTSAPTSVPPPIDPVGDAIGDGVPTSTPCVAQVGFGPVAEHTLTPRQREVLQLMRRGLSNRRIGAELGLAIGTVKSHVSGVLRALDVGCRTAAIVAPAVGLGMRS